MDLKPNFSWIHAINAPPGEALDALQHLYAQLDADIAARKPICNTSGRCCNFEVWGHRLYVSTLELAFFRHVITLRQTNALASRANVQYPPAKAAVTFPLPLHQENGILSPGCPWQIANLCTAREARPLGCRIYFCDSTAQSWQQERYEHYHQKIIALHGQFHLPYHYLEWRSALTHIDNHPQ